jgi:hypothetical protein
MYTLFVEPLKLQLIEIQQNPSRLMDPKAADALSKSVSILEKMDPRDHYRGVILDLIRFINRWLAENQPEAKVIMEKHWEAIFYAVLELPTKKEGLFLDG